MSQTSLLSANSDFVKRLGRRLNDIVSGGAKPSSHSASVIDAMSRYNMAREPDEAYYARQYLHWILPEIDRRFGRRDLRIFDLGCGQGRLSVPLAEWCALGGGQVTGVDLTPAAIEHACSDARAKKLSNLTFQQGDLLSFLQEVSDASADVVLLIEVTFFLPSYREAIKEVARILRPGGVAFIAFRSQYYNVLQTIKARLWDSAQLAWTHREGRILNGPVHFTWQTPEDVKRILAEARLEVMTLRGIGVCSGLQGDSLSSVARPSRLTLAEQDRLMKLECALAETYAACGRYILATAERLQ